MSFEAYFRFLVTHWLTAAKQKQPEKTQKGNKPLSISHTWFGLFPFSIRLIRHKSDDRI